MSFKTSLVQNKLNAFALLITHSLHITTTITPAAKSHLHWSHRFRFLPASTGRPSSPITRHLLNGKPFSKNGYIDCLRQNRQKKKNLTQCTSTGSVVEAAPTQAHAPGASNRTSVSVTGWCFYFLETRYLNQDLRVNQLWFWLKLEELFHLFRCLVVLTFKK